MATHPIVGTWMATTPTGPAPGTYFADGTVVIMVPATQAGPRGVTFHSTEVGSWEPVSERGAHFTGVQLLSDADGNYTGSITIDGFPVVSEDGQTLLDDSPETTVTIRDADGVILDAIRGGPPVTGIRMGVGAPGFSPATPTVTTPTT